METWRERLYLMLLGAVTLVLGIIVLVIRNSTARFDMLAAAGILGGLAMIVVALVNPQGRERP